MPSEAKGPTRNAPKRKKSGRAAIASRNHSSRIMADGGWTAVPGACAVREEGEEVVKRCQVPEGGDHRHHFRTFKVKEGPEGRYSASLLGFKLAEPVPVRLAAVVVTGPVAGPAGGGRDVDVADDPAVPEPALHDLSDIVCDVKLVQFVVPGRDDVVRDGREQVERGAALRERGRFGVDEAVAVDAVAGVDDEEVDSESARVLLHPARERVKVCLECGHRIRS